MKQTTDNMEGKVNIKELILKIAAKWYYFLITLSILMPLAFAYIYFADNNYLIRASILLNGETKSGLNSENFIKGMELMSSHTELDDEIGILKSYNLSESTIKRLDFGITYYAKSDLRTFEPPEAAYPFRIELDSSVNQLVGVPIYLDRISDSTFSVSVSGENVGTYNYYTNKPTETISWIGINSTGSYDKPFVESNLSFRIKLLRPIQQDGKTKYHFVLHNLSNLADNYREKLEIKPISIESNMVEVSLKSKNPAKGIRFLNSLLDVYRTNELAKKK